MGILDRLNEKAALAGGMVARQAQRIERKFDEVIEREPEIEKKTDEAMARHNSVADGLLEVVGGMDRVLDKLQNDPLYASRPGSKE